MCAAHLQTFSFNKYEVSYMLHYRRGFEMDRVAKHISVVAVTGGGDTNLHQAITKVTRKMAG